MASQTLIWTGRTPIHQFIWKQQQQKYGALDGSPMECGVVGEHYETPYFPPNIGTHLPGMTLPRTAWVRLNPLRPLRLVSVAQKNRPLTYCPSLSHESNSFMERMAWRFWTTRQSNGCSTPAPRYSAAEQWITRAGSSDEEEEWFGTTEMLETI